MSRMGPKVERFVSYLRVSTDRQGRSGLGLEAQRAAVDGYVAGRGRTLAEVVEIESGRRPDRPELARALALCRAHKATLIIAKLDRLARSVNFISNLIESGVEFVAVDFPKANRLTIHILAAVAEHEREMISARTKAALAAAKERGVKLGGFRGRPGTAEDCRRATAARGRKADAWALNLAPILADIDPVGTMPLQAIAAALEAREVPLPLGGYRWSKTAVQRLRRRLAALQGGAAQRAA